MEKVEVRASRSYDILIEKGLLSEAGEMIADKFDGKRFCVITDKNVEKFHLDTLKTSLENQGIRFTGFVFEPGEGHKTMQTVTEILAFLAENRFTRGDMLIALGGGIVGDVTGFAASIYQRGIEFIQIPTTLLAAVDSSVGGKTGVNLGGLKNQVGAFWQPSLVICDPEVFGTLPKRELSAGMAEVIKYAAICRPALADALERDEDIEKIIAECVTIKRDIVEHDERDTGERQLLNLGHTFGHAVEKVGKNEFNHGEAVAIGTVMAFKAAESLGLCKKGELQRLLPLLKRYALPTECGYAAEDLFSAMQSDKKRLGGGITLVLPRAFGDTVLYKTDMDSLEEIIRGIV